MIQHYKYDCKNGNRHACNPQALKFYDVFKV